MGSAISNERRVTIISDASYCPETRVGGYGFWVASDRGKRAGSGQFRTHVEDNNIAEMMAMLNALHCASSWGYVRNGDSVLLQTDCTAAIHVPTTGTCKNITSDKKRLCDWFNKKKKALGIRVVFRHVKGHTRRKESRYAVNRNCDKAAKAEMRKARAKIKQRKAQRLGEIK